VGITAALRRDAAEEEHEVPRLLGQAAHEVAVPLLAVGDVDAHLVAAVGDALLLLGPDAVEHLVLEGLGGASVLGGQGAGDLDEPRVVAGDHRVPLAGHEDLEAAHVRLVDVAGGLVCHRLRLLVRPLAEPDPAALVGEVGTVRLGPVEVGLEHGADGREVLAQLAQCLEGAVGGGVVLHVQGHRGAGVRGRLADLAGVLEGDLVAVAGKRLAQRGELERGLGGPVGGEPGLGERGDQGEVGVPGVLGLAELGGVLAEVVDGRHPVAAGEATGRAYGVLGARPGNESVNDVAAHRRSFDGVTHRRRGGELQQAVAQQVTGLHGSNLAPVPGRPSGRLISGTGPRLPACPPP